MNVLKKDEVEPILRALGNDYTIEKGEDGTETIVVHGKEGGIVASFNDKETKFFDPKFEQEFEEAKENEKGLSDKVKTKDVNTKKQEKSKKVDEKEENENEEQNDEKEKNGEKKLENKDAKKKEEIEKELGDEYVVSAEIDDEEISRKLIATEGFIGNPLIAFNKNTKEFVLVGNQGNGRLVESQLYRTSTIVNVEKYNFDGSIVEEKSINGMLLLPPENNDGLDLRVNEYGEIEINKIVNARGNNPQMFPVDTKQRVPSTQEISDMKKDGNKMEEITEIIDEMQGRGIIEAGERDELLEEIATNGKTAEEDKAKLKKIAENKEKEEEKEKSYEETSKDLDDEEYYRGASRDPRNW